MKTNEPRARARRRHLPDGTVVERRNAGPGAVREVDWVPVNTPVNQPDRFRSTKVWRFADGGFEAVSQP